MTIFTERLWVILCLLFFNVPAYGRENGLNGAIRVGIFPFNPINYIDKDGTAKGLNPDLLREIFRNESNHLFFVPGSWAQGLTRLQSEEIDIMMSVGFSEQRAKVMDYGRESVLQLWGQVFVRPNYHSKNISDFFNQKVGVMRKDISGKNFITTVNKLGGSCQIVEYDSHDEVFLAVQNGKVDGGVAPQHFGLRHASKYDLIGTSILFSPFSIFFTSKKGFHKNILDHIDKRLGQWKKDQNSVYYGILNKWITPTDNRKTVPTWLFPAFLFILFAVLISVCFILLLNTSVKRKTRELKESESRFTDIVLNINDLIWETDALCNCTYCSGHSLKLLGYPPEEMVGRSLFDCVPPEGLEEARCFFYEMMGFGEIHKKQEQPYYCKDGSNVFLHTSTVPILGKSGKILGYRGVATDISAQKNAEAEKRTLENRLTQAQKMEAVGTLAGGIAHDFNNILAAIIGFTELALDECEPESQMAQYLDESLRSATRAKELVKQILAFSRQSETNCISLQPFHIIKETIKMLRPSLPTTIEIQTNIDQSDDTILADPTQLNQIVMNLCTNAFHAMERTGGILNITMNKVVLSKEDLFKEPQISPGPFIQISVADSGTGISQEIKDKMFDPYFTTKELGKGTGMGLPIVHGIVKGYQGVIVCNSKPGEGTVFQVFLPIQKRDEIDLNDDDLIVPNGSERILFVDDEKIIVDINTRVLENLGYSVMAMTDSRQALAIFKEMPERFDLVITDQTMPGLTGEDLARELLRIRTELPIILCTGHSTIMTAEKATAIGIKAFVLKPLARKELARLIRKVLADNKEKTTNNQTKEWLVGD